MRAFAEQGVEQAKRTFDNMMAATKQAVATFEGQTAAAQSAARDLQQQAIGFAERNIAASFDFAQSLVRAKTPDEIAKLHAEFVAEQMQAMTGQARELARNAGKAAGAAKGTV
jgi:phasin